MFSGDYNLNRPAYDRIPGLRACIVQLPSENLSLSLRNYTPPAPLPSPETYDLVCTMAHFQFKDREVRWSRNPSLGLLSAAAHLALSCGPWSSFPNLVADHLLGRWSNDTSIITDEEAGPRYHFVEPFPIPVPIRIHSGNDGRTYRLQVPVHPETKRVADPVQTFHDYYRQTQCGNYTEFNPSQPIEIEVPLDPATQLPTGNLVDIVTITGGMDIKCTVIDIEPDRRVVMLASKLHDVDENSSGEWLDTNQLIRATDTPNTYHDGSVGSSDVPLSQVVSVLKQRFSVPNPNLTTRQLTFALLGYSHSGYDGADNFFICGCQGQIRAQVISPAYDPESDASPTFDEDIPEHVIMAVAAAAGLPDTTANLAWIMGYPNYSSRKPDVIDHTTREVASVRIMGPDHVYYPETRYKDIPGLGRRAVAVMLPFSSRCIMQGMSFYSNIGALRWSLMTGDGTGDLVVPDRVMDEYAAKPETHS